MFLRKQVRWSVFLCLSEFSSVYCDSHKGFSVVNEAEIHVSLEFSCFFYDPADVGKMIYGSSAFSKSSLYIWKFSVHILLKSSFKDFEHYLASMWNEYNCAVVWILNSDHELLIAKFRLKWKNVGKTPKPFRDDLNQIPHDYTMEMVHVCN